MREKLNDIVAGILLIVGLVLSVGGVALHMCGASNTRWMVGSGALMVIGVFLYCQLREVDDGRLDDGE